MDDRKLALRIFLVGLVAVTLYAVTGCADTQARMSQDVMSLHSPSMNHAIWEARK